MFVGVCLEVDGVWLENVGVWWSMVMFVGEFWCVVENVGVWQSIVVFG